MRRLGVIGLAHQWNDPRAVVAAGGLADTSQKGPDSMSLPHPRSALHVGEPA